MLALRLRGLARSCSSARQRCGRACVGPGAIRPIPRQKGRGAMLYNGARPARGPTVPAAVIASRTSSRSGRPVANKSATSWIISPAVARPRLRGLHHPRCCHKQQVSGNPTPVRSVNGHHAPKPPRLVSHYRRFNPGFVCLALSSCARGEARAACG